MRATVRVRKDIYCVLAPLPRGLRNHVLTVRDFRVMRNHLVIYVSKVQLPTAGGKRKAAK